jgi:hypothetical protein
MPLSTKWIHFNNPSGIKGHLQEAQRNMALKINLELCPASSKNDL